MTRQKKAAVRGLEWWARSQERERAAKVAAEKAKAKAAQPELPGTAAPVGGLHGGDRGGRR